MEWILSWVRSGLLFGIFASVILMLCPNKAYMKHIGMIVGLLFILVMLHPVMELFQIDESTYASYIKNFLIMETEEDKITEANLDLYEESVSMQLMAALQEAGYPIKQIRVAAKEDGTVDKIELSFSGTVNQLEKIEIYLKNLFGEEVRICYENE
ncbi:MAG: stage III sporulation protein AF [Lachnospiraceae bacterium]